MPQLVEVKDGGIRWHVLPEHREQFFGPDGFRLREWLSFGQARVVKHGPHRTVYRVILSNLDFYLKHYRLMDARAWFRQLVRPAKARRELQRSVAVAGRGVATFTPLGMGELDRGPGESFLITQSLPDASPLNSFIEQELPLFPAPQRPCLRLQLARELGRFVARLHDAGILHHDFHPGNILVSHTDHLGLYVIDLHAVRLSGPLNWRASRDNLVVFNRWFILRASRTDRLRFWRAYCEERETRSHHALLEKARDLEQRTWLSNLSFWRHRDRRCLATNRYYQRLRSKTVVGHAVRDLDPVVLAGFLDDPDEPFRRKHVALLKDSPSSTVMEMEIPIQGVMRRVIYKRFRVTTWTDPWVALMRRTAALRSWIFGQGLRERLLPTARPLAIFHRCRGWLLREGYLLTEKIPDALDLHGFMAGLADSKVADVRQILRRQIEQVACLVRELHRRQLSHRDLKANNILVSQPWTGQAACWLIDLVGVRRHWRLPHGRRVQNLARLHASFCRHSTLTRADKLRFLRVYLQWGLFGKTGWKTWWRAIEQATHRKIARNRRTGRPLA